MTTPLSSGDASIPGYMRPTLGSLAKSVKGPSEAETSKTTPSKSSKAPKSDQIAEQSVKIPPYPLHQEEAPPLTKRKSSVQSGKRQPNITQKISRPILSTVKMTPPTLASIAPRTPKTSTRAPTPKGVADLGRLSFPQVQNELRKQCLKDPICTVLGLSPQSTQLPENLENFIASLSTKDREAILKGISDLSKLNVPKETAKDIFFNAVKEKNVWLVKFLCAAGECPNIARVLQDHQPRTLLIEALLAKPDQRTLDIVYHLMRADPTQVNVREQQQGDNGYTPLMLVASSKPDSEDVGLKLLQMLLAADADNKLVGRAQGETRSQGATGIAVDHGNLYMLPLLMQANLKRD